MKAEKLLRRLFDEVVREAKQNPAFEERLSSVLGLHDGAEEKGRKTERTSSASTRRGGRRAPGALDPFEIFPQGEHVLRDRLGPLTPDQLKDIIAEHGMDTTKLALKWKNRDRLIDLIVGTVRDRLAKGDAFR